MSLEVSTVVGLLPCRVYTWSKGIAEEGQALADVLRQLLAENSLISLSYADLLSLGGGKINIVLLPFNQSYSAEYQIVIPYVPLSREMLMWLRSRPRPPTWRELVDYILSMSRRGIDISRLLLLNLVSGQIEIPLLTERHYPIEDFAAGHVMRMCLTEPLRELGYSLAGGKRHESLHPVDKNLYRPLLSLEDFLRIMWKIPEIVNLYVRELGKAVPVRVQVGTRGLSLWDKYAEETIIIPIDSSRNANMGTFLPIDRIYSPSEILRRVIESYALSEVRELRDRTRRTLRSALPLLDYLKERLGNWVFYFSKSDMEGMLIPQVRSIFANQDRTVAIVVFMPLHRSRTIQLSFTSGLLTSHWGTEIGVAGGEDELRRLTSTCNLLYLADVLSRLFSDDINRVLDVLQRVEGFEIAPICQSISRLPTSIFPTGTIVLSSRQPITTFSPLHPRALVGMLSGEEGKGIRKLLEMCTRLNPSPRRPVVIYLRHGESAPDREDEMTIDLELWKLSTEPKVRIEERKRIGKLIREESRRLQLLM